MEDKDSKITEIKRGRFPKNMSEEEKNKRYLISRANTAERQKIYYEEKLTKEITCDCGRIITLKHFEIHKKTDLHKKRMEKKNSQS